MKQNIITCDNCGFILDGYKGHSPHLVVGGMCFGVSRRHRSKTTAPVAYSKPQSHHFCDMDCLNQFIQNALWDREWKSVRKTKGKKDLPGHVQKAILRVVLGTAYTEPDGGVSTHSFFRGVEAPPRGGRG